MPTLFSSLTIKDITLSNRLAISPMCMYSATDGYANDFHLVHLGARAIGGAGLIIQEATAVSPEGRITPGDLGLYRDDQVEMLRRINAFLSAQGAIPGIQLAHAGRKAGCARPWEGGKQIGSGNGGWRTVAPSAIGYYADDEPPMALDMDGIQKVIADFGTAAGRAHQAGYKVLEIHAAHGYLVHEFLSPLSNHRTDEYGGSFGNRIRLLVSIIKEVQKSWPSELPLFVRISVTDWAPGGWDIEEAVQLAAILKTLGVDLLDTSSGGLVPEQQIPLGPGYQVPFAERIRKETGLMTGSVGLITDAGQANEIIENGQADLVLIGRESLRDPQFPLNAARELGQETHWPKQYLRAW